METEVPEQTKFLKGLFKGNQREPKPTPRFPKPKPKSTLSISIKWRLSFQIASTLKTNKQNHIQLGYSKYWLEFVKSTSGIHLIIVSFCLVVFGTYPWGRLILFIRPYFWWGHFVEDWRTRLYDELHEVCQWGFQLLRPLVWLKVLSILGLPYTEMLLSFCFPILHLLIKFKGFYPYLNINKLDIPASSWTARKTQCISVGTNFSSNKPPAEI